MVSQNAGVLVVVLENSIYRAVWFVQMISSITSSDWGTCNSQWLTQNRTNLEMSNINFIWQIYMFIPCSVLILASDWLTTVKYEAVSHV